MHAIDSLHKSGRKKVSTDELSKTAERIRSDCVSYRKKVSKAETEREAERVLDTIDLITALYFGQMRRDPGNPLWEGRDRIFCSGVVRGSLYLSVLEHCGYVPAAKRVEAENTAGRLRDCLGIAVGSALRAKIDSLDYRVYSLMEWRDHSMGTVWESAMAATGYELGNLVAVVERPGNKYSLEASETLAWESAIEPLADKYASFGWQVIIVGGPSMKDLLEAFRSIESEESRPTVLFVDTAHETCREEDPLTAISSRNTGGSGKGREKKNAVRIESPSCGVYRAIESLGVRSEIVVLGSSFDEERGLSSFFSEFPERRERYISVSPYSTRMMDFAEGLAAEGKLPIVGSSCGAIFEVPNENIKLVEFCPRTSNVGSFSQRDESLAALEIPCDALEAKKGLELIVDNPGPMILRCGMEESPNVSVKSSPYLLGIANVLRFRGGEENTLSSFDIYSADVYKNEHEVLCVMGAGPSVSEIMQAAAELKGEYGVETRILNLHTIIPVDEDAVARAIEEIDTLLVVDDFLCGDLSKIVAAVMVKKGLSGRGLHGLKNALASSSKEASNSSKEACEAASEVESLADRIIFESIRLLNGK